MLVETCKTVKDEGKGRLKKVCSYSAVSSPFDHELGHHGENENVVKGDSNPGSLECESGILSHHAPCIDKCKIRLVCTLKTGFTMVLHSDVLKF